MKQLFTSRCSAELLRTHFPAQAQLFEQMQELATGTWAVLPMQLLLFSAAAAAAISNMASWMRAAIMFIFEAEAIV